LLSKLTKEAWFIGSGAEQKLKEKIERIGKPLKDWDVKIYYGIKTGLNEAFIITTEKRNEILANCKDINERKRTEAIIKPILRGRDIKRYYYEWAGLWVITAKFGFYKEEHLYPAIVEHLKQYQEKLKGRGQCQYTRQGKNTPNKDYKGQHHWLELDNNPQDSYLGEFEKEKVVWASVGETYYCWVDKNYLVLDTNYFTTSLQKWQLGVLNSKFIINYINGLDTLVGSMAYRHYKYNFEKIPFPIITPRNESIVKQIESLVEKIITSKQRNPNADTSQWEKEIDRLVYKLYDLTKEEIEIIERGK
jgi:hypothetical protein